MRKTAVIRGVWNKKIWYAKVTTVVHESVDLIALYLGAGTIYKIPQKWLSLKELVEFNRINLINQKWTETYVLMLIKPGDAHAIWLMWNYVSKKLINWYIDLQEPLRKTNIGYDTMDHLLDIVVEPDLSNWYWKDGDELDRAVALGMFSQDKSDRIRKEGDRVIEKIERNQPPFCSDWENWLPPTDWQPPIFPEGWEISG